MTFSDLGLAPELLRAVAAQGYEQPTPIQAKSIPAILDGHDVLAGAQTGTGKTAAFTLPILQMLDEGARGAPPRVLVLAPTRELAAQVGESVSTYGRHKSLRSAVIFGGVNIKPQIAALERGIDVLIATPGRLLDHASQGTVDLSQIEILVLDEADRMLDMGFIHDIRRVLKLLPRERQTLLFSATYSEDIRRLADALLNSPVLIEVARRNTAAETVDQSVYLVPRARKRHLLSHLVESGGWSQVLVFTRTKHGANRLAQQLTRAGIDAAPIHGNKSQAARTRALAGFKDGTVRVLVATDIAARGLDIDGLPYVVNFELPNVPEDYVHRIGRTGRAGAAGRAYSLVDEEEAKLLRDIERVLGRRISREALPDLPPGVPDEPDPRADRSPRGAGQRGGTRHSARQPRPAGRGRDETSGGTKGNGDATAKPQGTARTPRAGSAGSAPGRKRPAEPSSSGEARASHHPRRRRGGRKPASGDGR